MDRTDEKTLNYQKNLSWEVVDVARLVRKIQESWATDHGTRCIKIAELIDSNK